jgi:hypothetical protein
MSNSANVVKKEICDLLENDQFQKNLITAINKDVNIPMINEKTEKKVIKSLLKIVMNQIIDSINDTSI